MEERDILGGFSYNAKAEDIGSGGGGDGGDGEEKR